MKKINIARFKNNIKKNLPSPVVHLLDVIIKSKQMLQMNIYDSRIMLSGNMELSKEKIEYFLLLQTHILEKGLTHKEIRFGFGNDVLRELSYYLTIWNERGYDQNSSIRLDAISALNEYVHIHKKNNKFNEGFFTNLFGKKIMNDVYDCKTKFGGTYIKTKAEMLKNSNFTELVNNRISVREFTDGNAVDLNIILESINLAKRSPSSCNRQTIKTYYFSSERTISKILSMHNGIRGFGTPPGIILVTSDSLPYSPVQRNLPFVDGGLFMMTLLYALLERGIASTVLNAAFVPEEEKKLKKMFDIGKNEYLIGFVVIGNIPETMIVANSYRTPVENTLVNIG